MDSLCGQNLGRAMTFEGTEHVTATRSIMQGRNEQVKLIGEESHEDMVVDHDHRFLRLSRQLLHLGECNWVRRSIIILIGYAPTIEISLNLLPLH
jgi:hypothetical protein